MLGDIPHNQNWLQTCWPWLQQQERCPLSKSKKSTRRDDVACRTVVRTFGCTKTPFPVLGSNVYVPSVNTQAVCMVPFWITSHIHAVSPAAIPIRGARSWSFAHPRHRLGRQDSDQCVCHARVLDIAPGIFAYFMFDYTAVKTPGVRCADLHADISLSDMSKRRALTLRARLSAACMGWYLAL